MRHKTALPLTTPFEDPALTPHGGPSMPFRPPPGMPARLRVRRDLPRPGAKTGPGAKGQTKRPLRRTRPTRGRHDGPMIRAPSGMTCAG